MRSADTSPEIHAMQIEIYRRMSPDRRLELAIEMTAEANAITYRSIRSRIPITPTTRRSGPSCDFVSATSSFRKLGPTLLWSPHERNRARNKGAPTAPHAPPRTSTSSLDPSPPALDRFSASLDRDRFYVESTAQEALAARDQFNVIDFTTGWKVDLINLKDNPFDRRVRTDVFGVDLYIATAEDTVLAKLAWAAMGGSDRQVADAAAVLAVQGDRIDQEYLDRWAPELGVVDLLERARQG